MWPWSPLARRCGQRKNETNQQNLSPRVLVAAGLFLGVLAVVVVVLIFFGDTTAWWYHARRMVTGSTTESDRVILPIDQSSDDRTSGSSPSSTTTTTAKATTTATTTPNTIHVAIACCGVERTGEALTLIRSILLFHRHSNSKSLVLHLIHEPNDGNQFIFNHTLTLWQQQVATPFVFSFRLYHAQQPLDYTDLFAPCACQRLFLHQLLDQDVSHVIYLDTDTLLVSDIQQLWDHFFDIPGGLPDPAQGDEILIGAAVGEHELTSAHSYYKDDARHPYYNQTKGGQPMVYGINSGVLLLHLAALRAMPWDDELDTYLQVYGPVLRFYDQDLLNIYFANHPERFRNLSCAWNYRPDHCYYRRQHCHQVALLHGNRGAFHHHESPETPFAVHAFVLIYQAFSWGIVTHDNSSTSTSTAAIPIAENAATLGAGTTVTAASFAPPPLGTCSTVWERLHQLVQDYVAVTTAEHVTNNCQATMLPMVAQKVYTWCQNDDTSPGTAQQEQEPPQQPQHHSSRGDHLEL